MSSRGVPLHGTELDGDGMQYAGGVGHVVRSLFASSLCALVVVSVAPARALPGAAEILSGTIFGERDIAKVLAGEEVTTPVREVSPRELGVGLACLVPSGRRASLAVLRNAEPLMPEKYRDASGPLDLDRLDESFAALGLGSGAAAEARRYLAAEPGYGLNLSESEIAAFAALQPDPGQELAAVDAQLRRIFAERVRAYRSEGTSGIAPFARGNGESSSPGDELRQTTEGLDGFRKAFPAFHRALLSYPRGEIEDQEFWFWTRIRVLGRPVFMLHQRLAAEQGDVEVVVERQIYATQFLDVGQTVAALLPVQEGTLLFDIYRTWVDRWTGPGFTVGAKRKVGNELISSTLSFLARDLGLCGGE